MYSVTYSYLSLSEVISERAAKRHPTGYVFNDTLNPRSVQVTGEMECKDISTSDEKERAELLLCSPTCALLR